MDSKTHILARKLVLVSTLVACFVGMTGALTPDGLALMEFKSALTVISPLLENWNASDASPCSWGGINCTDSGHVRNINLTAQNPIKLQGNMSTSLGKLKFLEALILEHNMLSGSIPAELANCRNLVYLSVYDNLLSGDIPVVIYKTLNFTYFDVSTNNFSGDITTGLDDLSKLPAIQIIGMDTNNFSGTLPPSIGDATTLSVLTLGTSSNHFSLDYFGQKGGFGGEIPKELGKLVNLKILSLGGNNFTSGTIPELLNMSMLNVLDFGHMNLRGEIPPWLGNLTSLRNLFLRFNELNGTIPPSLGKLVNLTLLDLSWNNISGSIPDSFTSLINLNWLDLSWNNISGSIPDSFSSLINLIQLDFSWNNIGGSIPNSFASLINLEDISLSDNHLTGHISTNLFKNTTSLKKVFLQNNSLSGPIPQDFGRVMLNLNTVDISDNFFNGTLLDGLCNGGHLQRLYVRNNNFEGPIPSSLASCTSLIWASFRINKFSSIPDGFGKNSSLQLLWVQRNQLVGQLPKKLAVNSQLISLDLSENKLTGNISILEFSKLAQNLSFLNLAKNNFTGNIPSTLGMCKLLSHVDLSYNSFIGAVPHTLTMLSNLQELYLQGNKFTLLHSSIYSGLGTSLRNLNLAENPWNAAIGNEIGVLRILQELNLSYGGYKGSIPSTLGQLTQLEILDLSHNNLTGEIPSELGELMTSLISINVSFNHLSGSLPSAWVKILITSPNSFYGNPDLCLHYDANNVCINVSRPLVLSTTSKSKLPMKVTMSIILGAIVILALLVYIGFNFWRRGRIQEGMALESEIFEMNLTNKHWLLSFEEIIKVIENLSDEYIIGRGVHGVVYKVHNISDVHPFIAVKKIIFTNKKTKVFHKSFWAEVKSIGNARHRNLVRLLGFIKRDEVGLLLYEYISNGDLHSILHNIKANDNLHLTWDMRLHIAKGVAHGLVYLHHDYDTSIVHRDIKSSNVLLDNDLEAHISDFGLAKVLDMQHGSMPWSLSTQNVLGTHGYIAPEVGYGLKVKPQVDVYSYGVLLLELLSGKEPTHDPSYGEALDIVAWAKENMQLNKNKVKKTIFDPRLLYSSDSIATNEMFAVQEIALLCTNKNPADRPTMRTVEKMLEILSPPIEKANGNGDGKSQNFKWNGEKTKNNNQ